MAKYVLEDMVRAKRQRREVETPASMLNTREETKKDKKEKIWEEPQEPVFVPVAKPASNKRTVKVDHSQNSSTDKGGPRYTLWFVAFLSLLFFAFALSFLFSSAKVTVTPRIDKIDLKENFSANAEPVAGGLFFDLVVISGEDKKTIKASEEKDVATRATGTVVVFNAFSGASQSLDIDTRLSGSNGKLYKTKSKVIVPGMKDGVPGSVSVDIYGAEAGDSYNSGPLDFKILGFKGTSKYDKFEVRTKTGTDIQGGFIGKAPVVSEQEKTDVVALLKTSLRESLTKKAVDQIPQGFILFKDAVFLSAADTDTSTVYEDNKSMTITQKGTLYGLLFSEQKLTKKIAEGALDKYDGSDVYIPNIKELAFVLSEQPAVPFADLQNISFTLSGPAQVVWKVEEKKFEDSLLGQPKEKFNSILARYPNIESAILKVTPPWRSSIPEGREEIEILVNYPKND